MSTEQRFESLADRRIREAMEAGEFEGLEGTGRPLSSVRGAYDADWWARAFIRREVTRDRADALRRTIRSELPALRIGGPEAAARVADLNAAIDEVNAEMHPADRIPSIDL
jgi:hypothetical protein